MAKVNIVFGDVTSLARYTGSTLPIISGEVLDADVIASSASIEQSDAAPRDCVAQVTVSGNNVWAAFGTNPQPAEGTDFLLIDGTTREFAVKSGWKLGVVDEII